MMDLLQQTLDKLELAVNTAPTRARGMLSAGVHRLNNLRQGMINSGGASVIDAHVSFTSGTDTLAYIPKAVMLTFLSPLPSQWSSASGGTGVFRRLAMFEVLLLYILLPCLLFSIFGVLYGKWQRGGVILIFATIMAILLGLTIANIGILFRLRLQAMVPILIIIGVGGVPKLYKRYFNKVWRLFFPSFLAT